MKTPAQIRIAAETIVGRFPHADERVQAVLVQMLLNDGAPLDDDEDHTPCPRCGMWHLADGLPVPICPCGYCAHMARTGDRCDFCGEVRKAETVDPNLAETQKCVMRRKP